MMIKFLLIILSTICNVYSGDNTKLPNEGEFKFVVTIWHRNESQCSGTIINRRHILTRGHCVSGIPSSDLSIIAAVVDLTDRHRLKLSVESIHLHYGFEAATDSGAGEMIHWVHDIAVLKLACEMIWSSFLAPIELTTADYKWHLEDKCIVPGWRRRRYWQVRANSYIRWITAKVKSNEQCLALGIPLSRTEQCTSWALPNKRQVTDYDGSPFVCGDFFVGIIDGRRDSKYKTFLDLYHYLDFIGNAIDDTKTDANPREAPYIVSIWNQGSFKCGGIILNDLHILTAGHCVRHARETDLRVVAGHSQVIKKDRQIQWLLVDYIEIHSGYEEVILMDGPRSMQIKNNYALLTLTEPLVWGPTIGAAPLSNTNSNVFGQVCEAYRWHNAYTVDDEALLQLVWSQESILNQRDCPGAKVDLEADEFCVYSQYVERPMNGDSSGNPIVCGGLVIGIIIPNFYENPLLDSHKTLLNISPFGYLLNDVCSTYP